MATRYQNIRVSDLGQGIDSEAAENQIQAGYVEDAENADPKPTGQIEKRRGYQGYAGNVPVRVSEVIQDGTTLCFVLDDVIDLSSIRSTPIVVKGKVSNSTSGDFPSNSYTTRYYSEFEIDIRRVFATGTNTDTILANQHDITDDIIWGGAAQATGVIDTSNSQFILDAFVIDQASNDVDYTYTNGTGSAFDGFVFLEGRTTTTGTVYNSPPTSIGTGTTTTTIVAGTHALNNQNIIVKVFRDTGTEYQEIYPDAVVIDSTTGDVEITLTNGTGSAFNVVFSLLSVDSANFATGTIGGSGSVTVTIDATGESMFAFVASYLQNGTDFEQVIPDNIVADTSTSTISVTFTNAATTGRVFYLYWDFATIVTNQLCVTAANSATISDTEPQLTIWGLDHSEIYGVDRTDHEGWVSHIDSYRSLGENRLVSGLGGNIFTAQLEAEGSNATDHLMPTLYPRLSATLNMQQVIGPAFYDTADTPTRTRGYIQGSTGATNYFTIDTIAYDSGNGWVKYTLSVPNLLVTGVLATIISSTSGMEDRFTATQCGWAVHDGEFVIKQVTSGVNQLNIWVSNSSVDSADYNEVDVGGFGGIFTDRLTFSGSTTPPFLAEDLLMSGLFDDTDDFRAINSQVLTGTPTTLLENVTSETSLPVGLKITAQRTSSIIPLRNLTGSALINNLVRGDMLTYSEIERFLRIKSINVLSNVTITDIDGDGTEALVTISGADTDTLAVGSQILIIGSTSYNGPQTITSIESLTTFKISSTATTSNETGVIVGQTIEVDEELEFQDTETSTTFFTVHSRWIPAEFPTDNFNLTPKTRIHYFASNDYGDQPIIRSTMVQDNMYFTNGDDEVFKFDGTNIYRAGLFRWQPHLFTSADTTTAGKIIIDFPSLAYTANTANKYTISLASENTFQIGDILYDAADTLYYTILDITNDGTNAYIYVDRTISHATTASTLKKTASYKYYFRLNAIDANNNLLASAVTGSDDFVVRIADNSSIRLRVLGMPAWDIYDYDRLEVQIYRTAANSVAPFYRITTLSMKFDSNNGYFDYIDTDSDKDLRDFDEINTALKGAELGTAWTEPLRAKYVTSADNRLILANLKDYPQLDLNVVKNNNVLTASVFTNSSNKNWLFRKDSDDVGTVTDMLSRVNYEFRPVSSAIAVTGSTAVTTGLFTLAVANAAVAGDWVYLFHDSTHTTNNNLRFAGWWQILSATATHITVHHNNQDLAALGATDINKALFASVSKDVPVPIGTDYNYGMINGNRTGASDPYEFLAIRRLGDAIDASMRKVDIEIPGYETFEPWMVAAAGNEIGTGHLIVRQPRASTLTFEVVIPALTGDFDVYANSVKRAGSSSAGAITREFPSRIIISYPNFPEIFDNPTASVDADSDSAVDVNSADGQDITAVIPFFGESAFGAALKSGVVVVFKTNSIYLVDISAKAQGLPSVQKLETRGKGCTAPYSVTVTRAGIIFANETGIYRLGHDLKIDYVGRKYERKWKENINQDVLDFATATHDTEANAYKLSYAVDEDVENSLVAVYNHTREEVSQGYGSWTTYTNHATTGWANLQADSYFASTTGRVFNTRKLGDDTDFRDDSSPVSLSITTAALDFGDSGLRKIVRYITTHYRSTADTSGTTLKTATDLGTTFEDTDGFRVTRTASDTGMSDLGARKVVTIQSSPATKKFVYLQLKYENASLDEPVIIAGIDYTIGGLSPRGITQAEET